MDAPAATVAVNDLEARGLVIREIDPSNRRSKLVSLTADDGALVTGLGKQGVIVRAGTPLGGPEHIRVSYGTEAENRRFLAALAGLL